MQPALTNAELDRVGIEAEEKQLPSRDHFMLPSGQPGELLVT
jgi:hypothetical protein